MAATWLVVLLAEIYPIKKKNLILKHDI